MVPSGCQALRPWRQDSRGSVLPQVHGNRPLEDLVDVGLDFLGGGRLALPDPA